MIDTDAPVVVVSQQGRRLAREQVSDGSVSVTLDQVEDGRIEIVAEDADGRQSDPVDVQIRVLDRPELSVEVTAERWRRTELRIVGEPSSTYEIEGTDGSASKTWSGRLDSSGSGREVADLVDGEWAFEAEVRSGRSTSPTRTVEVEVAIGEIDAPDLELDAEGGSGTVTVDIVGPPNGQAQVTAADDDSVTDDVELDARGHGTATFDLTDGTWDVSAVAVDGAGRTSDAAEAVAVDVDLLDLELQVDEGLAATGTLSWTWAATIEPDEVELTVVDESGDVVHRSERAQGELDDLRSGTYTVRVAALSRTGREVVEETEVDVVAPLEASDIVLTVLVIGGVGYGGARLVRRRRSA